jgi:hypothetical protein
MDGEGDEPWTAKALGAALTNRGFDSAKVGRANTKSWLGFDLQRSAEPLL